MPSMDDLSRAWSRGDKVLDALMQQMNPVFTSLLSDLTRALEALPRKADGTLVSGFDAASVLDSIQAQRRIVRALSQLMPTAIESAAPLLHEIGVSVPPVSRRAQLVFATQAADAISAAFGLLNRNLDALIAGAASTPIPARNISKLAAEFSALPLSQAKTAANTALAGLQRETVAQAAKALPGGEKETLWLYVGPSDDATRPFCKSCVGKAFTSAQVRLLRNNQGLTVRSYGGGYNCRHSLVPVSPAYLSAIGLEPATSSDVSRANSKAKS